MAPAGPTKVLALRRDPSEATDARRPVFVREISARGIVRAEVSYTPLRSDGAADLPTQLPGTVAAAHVSVPSHSCFSPGDRRGRPRAVESSCRRGPQL